MDGSVKMEAQYCKTCGALVADGPLHLQWHEDLDEKLAAGEQAYLDVEELERKVRNQGS